MRPAPEPPARAAATAAPSGRQPAPHPLSRRALDFLLDDMATDVGETAIAHTRRTGRLATATREAAIQVQLRARGDFGAFQHLFDEVNAAPRPVELVAEQLIGGASRRAEAAMHARAQDGIRL